MKKQLLFISVILMALLSCHLGYDVEDVKDTKDSIGDFLVDFNWNQNLPINPTNVQITNDNTATQYPSKIVISCPFQIGIKYSVISWFEDETKAYEAYKRALKTFFTIETQKPANSSRPLSPNFKEWEHQNLQSGKTYYYLIKNYQSNNELVGCSYPLIGQTVKLPYNVQAEKKALDVQETDKPSIKSVKLKITWEWDKDWKCGGFNIYRGKTAKKIDFANPINKVPIPAIQNFYQDTIYEEDYGDYLYYAVKPIYNFVPSKYRSEIAMGKVSKPGAPGVPEEIKLISQKDCIKITWKEDSNSNAYRIHYKTPSTEWETIDIHQTNETPISTVYFYPTQASHAAKVLLIEDPILIRPDTNFFTNYTINIEGLHIDEQKGIELAGLPSADYTASVLPPAKITQWTFLNDLDKVRIEWESSLKDSTYDVYRNKINLFTSSITNYETIKLTEAPISKNFFEDTTAEVNTQYYYWVVTHYKNQDTFESGATKAVRGYSKPEFEVSQGTKKFIEVTFNGPRNADADLVVEYSDSQYSPKFQIKNGKRGSQNGTDTKPASYEDSLNYKCDPGLHDSEWKSVATIPATPSTIETNDENYKFTFGATQTAAFTGMGPQKLCEASDLDFQVFVTPGPMKVKIHYDVNVKTYVVSDISVVEEKILPISGKDVIKSGYREIDIAEFASECLQHVAYSQNLMRNIHEKAGLQEVGPAHEEWILRNGEKTWTDPGPGNWAIAYLGKAKVPVVVPIHYDHFKHPDGYLTISDPIDKSITTGSSNDNVQTTRVGITANGNLWGGDYFSGIYKGHLFFNLVISSSNKSGGTYEMYYNGQHKSIPWNFDSVFFK